MISGHAGGGFVRVASPCRGIGPTSAAGLHFRPRGVWAAFRKNFNVGKWFFTSQMAAMLGIQILLWLIVSIRGEVEAGVFAACLFVLQLANPIVVAFANVLTPWAARAFGEGGAEGVHQVLTRATSLLALVAAGFCAAFLLLGDIALQLFFGSEFAVGFWVVATLAVGKFASIAGLPIHRCLNVLERANVTFSSHVIGIAVTLVTALALLNPLGVLGAVAAYSAGIVAERLFLVVAYLRANAIQGAPDCRPRPQDESATVRRNNPDSSSRKIESRPCAGTERA